CFLGGGLVVIFVVFCFSGVLAGPPRNHNDLTRALECIVSLRPRRAVLTHVGDSLDPWVLVHPPGFAERVDQAHHAICL
ncbi:phosphonate metabolism protein PhnP, partial [Pseudomonas aeruginosa]